MCGIVGYIGSAEASPILIDGLKRLEYRGYDSAGVAMLREGEITTRRVVGKLRGLEESLRKAPIAGTLGIGHTRWATHGRPSEVNAHPHVAGGVAIVHNGIIENYLDLKEALQADGVEILSDTDTEIVAHLVHREVNAGHDLETSVRRALRHLHGAYAIAVVSAAEPERIIVAKTSSPLVIGVGEDEAFCGSDIPALLPYTRDMIFLEDGDLAILERSGVRITNLDGEVMERPPRRIDWSPTMAEKAGYKHFMLKEIFEQSRAIEDTLRGRLDRDTGDIHSHELGLSAEDAAGIKRVVLLACGTSHHAGIAGKYYIEKLARVPAVAELASEFRGRDPVVGEGDLVIAVSQSGETLDTLVAAQEAKRKGAKVLSIANVIGSAIPRLADATFYTHAGPEIGVASTKCFTAQLANLLMFAIWLGRRRGTLEDTHAANLVEGLARLPQQIKETLQSIQEPTADLARKYMGARDVLFLGRGLSFPMALEGALKLKEISYIHAEGYASGEMKHGPIALIDSHVPVLVLLPKDPHHERSLSNLQEAKARDAQVIAIATEGDRQAAATAHDMVALPDVAEELTPFMTVLPLQLFSYYVADMKGTDVDQPRNLAKTVTVE